MVIIMDGYIGFLLIDILVCHIVSLKRWVVFWVRVNGIAWFMAKQSIF
jgi:hypothetical protein